MWFHSVLVYEAQSTSFLSNYQHKHNLPWLQRKLPCQDTGGLKDLLLFITQKKMIITASNVKNLVSGIQFSQTFNITNVVPLSEKNQYIAFMRSNISRHSKKQG
ncbi:unnamed protein product [Cuscuta epithymum]|uniref:Uncharacterized protein n=1 Tax=Cuscuta epithymum TaxID=186058 RepID=A0AAV0DKG4_9ASTE|nr:unnamed protein product [Cuscuta epithymum]